MMIGINVVIDDFYSGTCYSGTFYSENFYSESRLLVELTYGV